MSWRPDGWREPGSIVHVKSDDPWVLYEAGADAMLKALKAQGKPYFVDKEQTWVQLPSLEGKGHLVCIPDDTKKERDV